MSVDEMRLRVRQFQTKARIQVVYSIGVGLGFGLLSVWGIYAAYQAYKWIWPSNLPPDAPVSTSLEFYRSELERRRDYRRHVWRRSGLTFCFLGLVIALAPAFIASIDNPRLLLNAAPFFVFLTVWFVAFFFSKKRGQSKLQQEIDELRTYESDAS